MSAERTVTPETIFRELLARHKVFTATPASSKTYVHLLLLVKPGRKNGCVTYYSAHIFKCHLGCMLSAMAVIINCDCVLIQRMEGSICLQLQLNSALIMPSTGNAIPFHQHSVLHERRGDMSQAPHSSKCIVLCVPAFSEL